VIYLTTVILLEKEVLKDMNSLEEYNMKKKSIDNGDLSASDDQLPDWVRKSKARRSAARGSTVVSMSITPLFFQTCFVVVLYLQNTQTKFIF
jgi:hypothetical protein